jgi:hypothetical protein
VAALFKSRAACLAESLSVTRLGLATSAFHDVFNANDQLAAQHYDPMVGTIGAIGTDFSSYMRLTRRGRFNSPVTLGSVLTHADAQGRCCLLGKRARPAADSPPPDLQTCVSRFVRRIASLMVGVTTLVGDDRTRRQVVHRVRTPTTGGGPNLQPKRPTDRSWSSSDAVTVEVVVTLPTDDLQDRVTGLEQALERVQ